jgi:hypothetical protein
MDAALTTTDPVKETPAATHSGGHTTGHAGGHSEMELPPVVLDLGKVKRRLVRELKQGEGELMDDVAHAVEAVRSNMHAELKGKELVPIVIVYERKPSRRRSLLPCFFLGYCSN